MTRAKELLDAATPLPWAPITSPPDFIDILGPDGEDVAFYPTEADAALIVYAVNRLPDYEATVEALRVLLPPAKPDTIDVYSRAREALARLDVVGSH